MKKITTGIVLLGLLATSCVSKKEYTAATTQLKEYKDQNAAQNIEMSKLKRHVSQLQYDSISMQKSLDKLLEDSVTLSKNMHQAEMQIIDLKNNNKQLTEKLTTSNMTNAAEVKALLADLQKSQEKLQKREDELKAAEQNLYASTDALNKSAKALAEKEKKVEELSSIISKQDSVLKNLQSKVDAAFRNFKGKGIEVVNKNGKVYVSLDEKLMFRSGSWEVDEKGANALKALSKFLGENRDINVTVEGHTDSLAYRGNGYILDNWDLGAKRATAIVRILLQNKMVNPAKISAAGRAEFCPITDNNTSESRSKNRRTEIILSPNIDELLEAMMKAE